MYLHASAKSVFTLGLSIVFSDSMVKADTCSVSAVQSSIVTKLSEPEEEYTDRLKVHRETIVYDYSSMFTTSFPSIRVHLPPIEEKADVMQQLKIHLNLLNLV